VYRVANLLSKVKQVYAEVRSVFSVNQRELTLRAQVELRLGENLPKLRVFPQFALMNFPHIDYSRFYLRINRHLNYTNDINREQDATGRKAISGEQSLYFNPFLFISGLSCYRCIQASLSTCLVLIEAVWRFKQKKLTCRL
jgi:hypothetical protein